MDIRTFNQFVAAMRRHVGLLQGMLLSNQDVDGYHKRWLAPRARHMLRHLEVARQSAIQASSERGLTLPIDVQAYYATLADDFYYAFSLAAQRMLERQGRMREVHATAAQAEAGEACPVCRELYEEGVVIGILQCDHRFHRRCIAGMNGIMLRCPICQSAV